MKLPAFKWNFRNLFWGGAVLLVAALLVAAFRPQPVLVDMAEVGRGPLTASVRDEGYTRIRETYVVSAPLSGRVLRIGNLAGRSVTAGEVVASMQPGEPGFLDERTRREAEARLRVAEQALDSARADISRAEAQFTHAEAELRRVEALFATDNASQRELDNVRLQMRAAEAGVNAARAGVGMRQAEVEAARARLMNPDQAGGGVQVVDLKSPVSGRILKVLQQSEAVLMVGTPIVEIGDPGDLEIVAEMLSSDAVQIREGAEASIENWGGGFSLRGRVRLVEPSGYRKISALGVEEQRVNVIIDLLDPREDWLSLGDGYRVEAAVTVWQAEDTVQVPVGALFRQDGAWAVFVVDNGRARLVRLEVGRNDGRQAQVISGLEPGQSVILYPGQSVEDGIRVAMREIR